MFSGIVEGTGLVKSITPSENDGAKITIIPSFEINAIKIGSSVAVNGVCLTLVSANPYLQFDVIPETLKCTNLGKLSEKSPVNLERSIKVGDRIDGHFVTGHVDCTSKIIDKSKDGNSTVLVCELLKSIAPYVTYKGSITINGVSLTVGKVGKNSFEFYIIPHTAEVTNLGQLEINSLVNIEVDILSRYVVNACQIKV